MPSDLAWIETIAAPAVVVDDKGRALAWNALGLRTFEGLRDLDDAARGLKQVAARSARQSTTSSQTFAARDRNGRGWRVGIDALGTGRALLVFHDPAHRQAPSEVDGDDDEPTAEVVRLPTSISRAWQERRPPSGRSSTNTRAVGRDTRSGDPRGEVGSGDVFAFDTQVDPDAELTTLHRRAPPLRLDAGLACASTPYLLLRGRDVVDANPAALDALARPQEDVVGRPISAIGEDEARGAPGLADALRACGVEGRQRFAWRVRTASGVQPVEAIVASVPTEAEPAWLLGWTPRAVRAAPEPAVSGLGSPERLAIALARAIRPLLVLDRVESGLQEALALVGGAIGADRCFLVLIEDDGHGRSRNAQRLAWAAHGVQELPDAARAPAPDRGIVPPRWKRVLSTGGVLHGGRRDFPSDEQVILQRYGVASLVIVPVRIDGRLVAFLGVDACRDERVFTTAEIEVLRGVADGFAGALRRRDAAVALQSGRDRYEAAVRGADLVVWEVDVAAGRLVHVDGIERILGSRIDTASRALPAFVELVHPEDRDAVVAAVEEHRAGRLDLIDVELRIHAGDRWTWVLLRGRITERDAEHRARRAHGTLLDIDVQKRLLDEVRAARATAERASDAKSRFLANMSHEVRTPLNAVLGMAALLQGTRLSHQQLDLVRTLRLSGEHLLALLNQILDVSQIESGHLELAEEPFDLRALLLEVRDAFRAVAEEKGLGLEVRLDDKLPVQVLGDALRFRQVLVNLIDNALKFTERGGVTMMAWCPDATDPHVVRIEVVDTGIGIPADQLGALFDPFAQVDGSYARRHGGSGLGLAIGRRLAELMGGRLSAESEPGRGAVFRFDLRIAPCAAVPAEVPPTVDLPRDLRILVVEDNRVNQKVAVGMLQRLGCSADVTDSGIEALETLEDGTPDVVLMDIQMPGMDGLETTRRIRERCRSSTWPWIIAVTAAAQAEDRERSLASGMNDYLAKPVRLHELQRALARAVGELKLG